MNYLLPLLSVLLGYVIALFLKPKREAEEAQIAKEEAQKLLQNVKNNRNANKF